MTQKIILLAITFLISCSGITSNLNEKPAIEENTRNQQLTYESLKIESKIYRGVNYTDAQGNEFNIRYMPISIKNTDSLNIKLDISFIESFNFIPPHENEEFNIIILPGAWAEDGVGITNDMLSKIPDYIESPFLNKTIEAGSEVSFAIASVYPKPTHTSGVLPRSVYVQKLDSPSDGCERLAEVQSKTKASLPIWLKLSFGEYCKIIACGTYSYGD